MKKMIYIFLFALLLITMIGCSETNPLTTSLLTTDQGTISQPTTEAPITNPTITIPTTFAPTTEAPTTMLTTLTPTTTEYVEPSIELNYIYTGSGRLNDPYQINIEEGQSTTYQINIQPSDAEVVYEVGQIIDDSFVPSDSNDTQGITLEGSNVNFFSIQAIKVGQYVVKIMANASATAYVKINVEEIPVDFSKRLKVLAIGNSFSVDGMEYLYKIADSWGVEEIVLGNLYIGGASLATHVDCIENNKNSYVYYKNTDDQWTYHNTQATVLDGLADEDWDIISIQQVSHLSGVPSSYNDDLEYLINYINENKTNNRAKIVWHMTWAYQADSTHGGFINYNNDQMEMYQAITTTVQSEILTNDHIEFVIPSGTAIQNLRTSYIGDTLTRDGYHLSLDIGRYTAGLTWFKQITGLSLNFVVYYPETMTAQAFDAAKAAVNNAVAHPYIIIDIGDQ